jgi:TRAP-type uncharacterized transport system substrate-binding protein
LLIGRFGWTRIVVVLCLLIVISLIMLYLFPAPPKAVTMATAFRGTAFHLYGERYKQEFAQRGVELVLRETAGAQENVDLIGSLKSDVQITFVNGGTLQGAPPPGVVSLGLVYTNPFWIFYASPDVLTDPQQLRGKRIAMGPVGAGYRLTGERVLALFGVTPDTATFVPSGGQPAVELLRRGDIEAVWMGGEADAPSIQAMLRMPGVRIMSFEKADALSRILPYLAKFGVPRGVFDVQADIPPSDVTLLATGTRVLIKNDLHSEIRTLLLETMKKEHGSVGLFKHKGEFPTSTDPEFPMATAAVEYYKNGPSFLYTHLPIWMTPHVLRAIALAATVLPVLLFVITFEPTLYRWIIRQRARALYRQLRTIERTLPTTGSVDEVGLLKQNLEALDRAASAMKIPMRHSDSFFSLKVHINLIRMRIAARLTETQIR